MKKLYLIACAIVFAFIPFQKTYTQCMCSDGTIPDSLAYEQSFDSIIAIHTTITFPKFDPAMGVLKCLKLSDTVTTIVSYNLENDLSDSEDYIFETFRRSTFTGPGFFSSITSPPEDYGPYSLAPKDSAGDNADIGPDTVFNKRYYQHYASANAAFYGTDSVDFDYTNTSTWTILTGSNNAIFTLRSYTVLDVKLVYYWCPFIVLATHISRFNASLKDNNIFIQWQVEDPKSTDKYEIEMSTDGKVFKNLGEGNLVSSGSVAKYDFLYNINQDLTGKLFFRIKQIEYPGRVLYSGIRSVSINKNHTSPTYSLYPNPSVTGVNIQFKNTGGNYDVELFSSTGQKIFQKKYSLNRDASVNIEWPQKPAPGIYYLKVKDLKSKLVEVARLQIQ
jgi:Secretion system C-terminal sorting domain